MHLGIKLLSPSFFSFFHLLFGTSPSPVVTLELLLLPGGTAWLEPRVAAAPDPGHCWLGGTWKNTGLVCVVWGEMASLDVLLLPFRGNKAS